MNPDKPNLILEFLKAVLTFLGGISIPLFTYLGVRYKKSEKEKKDALEKKEELIIHHKASTTIATAFSDLKLLSELNSSVSEIFNETKADRFLILMAANGVEKYHVVSVLYEREQDDKLPINAVNRYQNLLIDDQYRDMLHYAKIYGIYRFQTEAEDPCLLKTIYEREGVKESIVSFVCELKLSANNDVMLFLSVATKGTEFTLMERTVVSMALESTIKPSLRKVMRYDKINPASKDKLG